MGIGLVRPMASFQRAPPRLVQWWYQTCSVDRTCTVSDQLLESPDWLLEASYWTCPVPIGLVQSTRLVRPRSTSRELYRTCMVPHWTSLVKALPNNSFEVGAINRPPPTPSSSCHSEKQSTPWDPKFELLSLSLSLRSKPWFLFLREDSSFLECITDSSKSTSHSPSTTSLCSLLLVIQSPRWLDVARELPRIVAESQKVCIALFVGIDSEDPVGLGGNLRGLGLKETWPFVGVSKEM
jgi:hypothetical protein